jgi:hypothetical protein
MVTDLEQEFNKHQGFYKDQVDKNILPGRSRSISNKQASNLTYGDWIDHQFQNIEELCDRSNIELKFSKMGMAKFILNNTELSDLLKHQLDIYHSSEFHSKMVPTIDRKDYSQPFTLDNLTILSWEDKLTKWNTYTANHRINNTQLIQKEVEMLDVSGKKIRYFKSIAEAHKFLNVRGHSGKIFKCCENELDEAYGYKWRYASKLEIEIF